MKLSFVIPAYNEEKNIGPCLEAILAARAGKDYDIEIIVANNASTDKTGQIAQSFKEVKVADESRKGIVWARQAGFLTSSGGLIANIDADTRLPVGWIEKVLAEFKANPDLVALSGPYIYYDLTSWQNFLTKLFYLLGKTICLLTGQTMLQGGNYVVRRNALEKIGGYDTTIEFYGEDTDIARRISRVGKVKFTFSLPMPTSGRRLATEGFFKIGLRYGLNYFWTTFFKKPFTQKYKDVRN